MISHALFTSRRTYTCILFLPCYMYNQFVWTNKRKIASINTPGLIIWQTKLLTSCNWTLVTLYTYLTLQSWPYQTLMSSFINILTLLYPVCLLYHPYQFRWSHWISRYYTSGTWLWHREDLLRPLSDRLRFCTYVGHNFI